jgi:hypothetical protein
MGISRMKGAYMAKMSREDMRSVADSCALGARVAEGKATDWPPGRPGP